MNISLLIIDGVEVTEHVKSRELREYFTPDEEGPFWEFYFTDKSNLIIMGASVTALVEGEEVEEVAPGDGKSPEDPGKRKHIGKSVTPWPKN